MKQESLKLDNLHAVDERERAYWNSLFKVSPENLLVMLKPNDPFSTCQLNLLGNLPGKRVLELGCGDGIWAVRLAMLGAEVYAVDIADEAVALTLRRAEINGVGGKVFAKRMSAYALDFEDGFFDLIHGTSVLHHLNCATLAPELKRVLAADGQAVFMENSANNKFLMLARKFCGRFGISKWSSDDEYPLRSSDLTMLKPYFKAAKLHYPVFHFFFYLDAKFFKYRNAPVSRVVNFLDNLVYRYLPFLRRYSYHQIVQLLG
jgi:SAM-dependent methyltransferase